MSDDAGAASRREGEQARPMEVLLGDVPNQLRLSDPSPRDRPSQIVASLLQEGLKASVPLELDVYSDDGARLIQFLTDLSNQSWTGWDEPKSWESLEHALGMTWVWRPMGHAIVDVKLYDPDKRWRASGSVTVPSGALESMGAQIRRFLGR